MRLPLGLSLTLSGLLFYMALTAASESAQITLPAFGTVNTVAGTGTAGYFGDSGQAISADIYNPQDVAVDATGNIYIADTQNNRIRKVTATTGIITTVVGNGTAGFSGDGGSATNASLNTPTSVALDGFGNLFIADQRNQR